MKRFIVLFLISVFLLSGCAHKPPVELVDASAQILMVDSVEKPGEKQTALLYKFFLKNPQRKKIGDALSQIKVQIKPDKEFLSTLDQTVGLNIFDPFARVARGYQGPAEIPSDKQGEYRLDYILDSIKRTDSPGLISLDQKALNMIEQNAMNATLIVTMGDKEIAQFDLHKYKR